MRDDFLSILQCPISRTPLRRAQENEVAQLNERIARQLVENKNLELVEQPLEAGLVNADGTYLYPIYDGTPYLMSLDAIPLPSDTPAEEDR